MADEDYEIISHKDIEKLKEEIKELKEGKTSDSANNVIKRLDEMIEIFKTASISLQDEMPINDKITDISQKLETLLDQNQKIAEGILAIADMINENIGDAESKPIAEQQSQPKPLPAMFQQMENPFQQNQPQMNPMPRPRPMPPMSQMQSNFPPMPQMEQPKMEPMSRGRSPVNELSGLPPLPPRPPKKKGLF